MTSADVFDLLTFGLLAVLVVLVLLVLGLATAPQQPEDDQP